MVEHQNIELDGYDLDLFERIFRTEPTLREHAERLGRFLPHPRALLADLFGVLFKLNVMIRPPLAVSPSVLVNRRLVEAVLGHPGVKSLRAETQLDETATRNALVLVTDRVLRSITRKDRADPSALLEGMEIAETEQALEERKSILEHMDGLDDDVVDPAVGQDVKKALKAEVDELEKKLKRVRQQQARHADQLPLEMDNEIGASVERMTDEMAELDQNLRGLGVGNGGDGQKDARRRLELGERLAQSKKLRLLARLAGALKEVAFEARKRTVPRVPQTMHAVGIGRDLAHLLPSELPGLDKTRRWVHLDFLRRYVEGRLMQYELRAPASRGPMVVCVDGSGSMTGSKEIWAKAVALTLMEIARREKRRCLAMVFSDGPSLFEVELLARGRGAGARLKVRDEAVIAFAEHFPGGGTSFEEPLRNALQAVTEGAYRNGDIIFITDGQASISAGLVEGFKEGRRKHRFKVRGLLVDVEGDQQATELAKIADDVALVTDLTGDVLSELFARV